MCGVCGIVSFDHSIGIEVHRIAQMTESLSHRGPDNHGVWVKGPIGLGHCRLSIIDLTEAGHQPMSNDNGRFWISYNGEIYNFQQLRMELKTKGHRFKSLTDTEVIVHLYEEEGIECLSKLRGMFAFAIWDDNRRLLFLARDRFGQKPLYYYVDKQKLIFASEIKGLLASGLIQTLPDYEALHQYLFLGYVPHPRTGFMGIKKLPPAHFLMVDGGKVTLKPYWSLQTEPSDAEGHDNREARQRLRDLLMEATHMRMLSDVPIGVLLSGGVDSNAVAAMMSRHSDQIKTFTVGFEDELYDERKEARFLAEKLGTDHHEMIVKPEITEILPKLVRAYDEPFADPSAIPSYYVAQMASQYVKVVLNGDGGDESFAGYGKYVQGMLAGSLQPIPASIGGFFFRILDQKRAGKVNSLSEVLALSGGSPASAFAQLGLVIPVPYVDSLINPNFKNLIGTGNPLAHLLRCYEKHYNGDTVNTMLAVDRETYLPDDLLFKIDIATMSHSLEARSPLLDHHLVRYVAGLPGNLKLRGLKKKYILKKALHDVLPPHVLKRKKRGFDVPIGRWLKDELKETCRDALSDNGLIADMFAKNKLEKMFEDHLRGHKDWGRFFWMIIMLHLWFEHFFKNGEPLQQ
jgi:asparagine synthase (glutamine-hydrolysing)